MCWIALFSFLILCSSANAGASSCEDSYLSGLGKNFTKLFELENISGKFLNDLGDYEGWNNDDQSKYMLGRYTIRNGSNTKNIGNSFNSYVTGVWVPKNWTVDDKRIMSNYYINLSRTFLTENYFNYAKRDEDIELVYHDVEADAHKISEESASASSVMIVVFWFLGLLGVLGLIVEKSNLANKPNLNADDDEEPLYWDNVFDQDGFEDDGNKNAINNDEEYEQFKESENQLITSKTLWGIILLSFSFSRNAKRLFQFSVIRRKNLKYNQLIEGARVLFLFWVMAGNTFLYSFYSYPANFEKKTDISNNYFFITIFNNEFAFDMLLFFTAFLTGHELLDKFDKNKSTTCSYILNIAHFVIRMIFPVLIILGLSAVFPLLSGGPMWSVLTGEINDTCDKYLWTHAIFISNLYPFKNNIGDGCCLPWLWFVSTEFQFYFVGLFLTVLYKKMPKATSIIIWCICLCSLFICTIIGIATNAASLSQYDSETYSLIFNKPWSKIFGYCLGLFIGFIMYEYKRDTADRNKRFCWQIVSWMNSMNIFRRTIFIILAFIMIALPSIFQWLFLFKNPFLPFGDNNSEKIMYISYITLGKPIFFFGVIIVVIFCLLDKLKWITLVVGNYVWGPMTELSYSAYLVHYFMIVWYYSSLVQTLYISISELAFTSFAVIFVSFTIAIPFAFVIEIPSRNLIELTISGFHKRTETKATPDNDSSEKISGSNFGIQAHAVSDVLSGKAEASKSVMQPVTIPKDVVPDK